MKKLTLFSLVALLSLIGCDIQGISKPFIITNKLPYDGKIYEYWYEGNGGNRANFYDSCNKYNVGDTLK